MSLGFIHFYQAAGDAGSDPIPAALLRQGLGLRLYVGVAELLDALSGHQILPGPQLAMLAGSITQSCQAASELRRKAPTLALVALLPEIHDQTVLQAMHAGIDACWHRQTPVAQITAGVMRFMDRHPSGAGSDTAPGFPPESWRLRSRAWKLQAPGGAAITLTTAERALILALCRAPGGRASHAELILAVDSTTLPGQPETGTGAFSAAYTDQSARRLSVVVSRLRRKCQAAGMEMPIHALRRMGYEICVDLRDQAVALVPARERPGSRR